MYIAYLIALLIKELIPFRMSKWIARRVAEFWYVLFAERRRSVLANLSLLRNCDRKKIKRLSKQLMRNFSEVVTEFLYMDKMSIEQLRDLVDFESIAPLVEEISLTPSILITGHIGNWELAAGLLSRLGANLCVVVFENPDKRIAKIFHSKRKKMGLKVISTEEAGKRLREIVRASSVGIVADRDYSGLGMETKIFNQTVTMPSGYATLATSEGIPVYCGFLVKCSDAKYRLLDLEKIYDPRNPTKPADIVQRFVSKLERIIAEHPEQWYLFERIAEIRR